MTSSNARQDQDVNGIEPHGRERVDLLAHLHRAEFGGVGASRPARDHNGDDQHAELTQHRDADHVDGVGLCAESAEVEEALLRDDGADQESDQRDDGDRLPPDAIELIDQRGQPQRTRPAQRADHGHEQCAEHLQEDRDVFPRTGRCLAEVAQPRQHRIGRGDRDRCVAIDWRTSSSSPLK